jgi:hypothetical protein
MPAPIDARLEKMLRASEAAGKIVVAARIDGGTIELTFESAKRQEDADLIDWKPRRK